MGELKKFKPRKKAQEAQPQKAGAPTIEFQFDDGRGQVGGRSDFRALLEEQQAAFRRKFKRDPRPRDPLFFDPDLDVPVLIAREKLPAEAAAAFEQATVHGAMVYAQFKVGFFLSPMNYDVASEEEQLAWEDAIREFAYLKGVR